MNILFSLLFVLMFLIVPVALAKTSAGTLSSSFLWKADLFFEKTNVALTFDKAEKTRLHLQHAAERLAEAQVAIDSKNDVAAEAALNQRETDLDAALVTFNSYQLEDKAAQLQFVTEIQASIDAQTAQTLSDDTYEETAREQQIGFETALADYDLPNIVAIIDEDVSVQTNTNVQSSAITGNVVVDTDESVEVETAVENTVEAIEEVAEEIIPASTFKNIITVKTYGDELAKIHMVINDIEKNLSLSITDPAAIVKELSKRTFLSIDEVNKTAQFSTE